MIDGEDLGSHLSLAIHGLKVSLPSLHFPSTHQLLLALARVLKVVSNYSESAQSKIQFRKLSSRFCQSVEDHKDESTSNFDCGVRDIGITKLFATDKRVGPRP